MMEEEERERDELSWLSSSLSSAATREWRGECDDGGGGGGGRGGDGVVVMTGCVVIMVVGT